jgi:hypothetical protein
VGLGKKSSVSSVYLQMKERVVKEKLGSGLALQTLAAVSVR